MKILFAECCGSLVVPHSEPDNPNYCKCRSACCWWDNPHTGLFACWSTLGKYYVSIIGLHNGLLADLTPPNSHVTKTDMEQILADTPSTYLFKTLNSLVIRFRPGFTNDTRLVTVPGDIPQPAKEEKQ